MKVKSLDGREHTLDLTEKFVYQDDRRPRSDLHVRCRALLQSVFPSWRVYEEVNIPGEQLFIDFFIPRRKIAIEVQGEQHFKFVPHFHANRMEFMHSQARDRRKARWCSENGIALVCLPFNETDDEWRARINDA